MFPLIPQPSLRESECIKVMIFLVILILLYIHTCRFVKTVAGVLKWPSVTTILWSGIHHQQGNIRKLVCGHHCPKHYPSWKIQKLHAKVQKVTLPQQSQSLAPTVPAQALTINRWKLQNPELPRCLALRTRDGRLKKVPFVMEEISLPTLTNQPKDCKVESVLKLSWPCSDSN